MSKDTYRERPLGVDWKRVTPAATEADERNYRRTRGERRHVRASAGRRKDDDELLWFACIWAPFGGPPETEVFIRYGITKSKFVERLWQVITSKQSDLAIVRQLSLAYPSPTSQTRE